MRALCLLLCLALPYAPAIAREAAGSGDASLEAPAEPPELLGWTTSDWVFVRDEPGTTSQARGKVRVGNRFALEDTGTVWARVATGRFKGAYVNVRNLRLSVTPAGKALVKEVPIHGEKSWESLAKAIGPYTSVTEEDAITWLRALNGGTDAPPANLKRAWARNAP